MIGSKITPYEIEVLTKDGKKLPFEINAAKIKYKGKAADMVVFRDITERKQAEEEIKRARDDYLSITNLTGDIIVKVDADGRWSFLNDGACQFWGKSREELIGSTFADYLHPDDLEKTMAAIEECKNQKLKKVVVNRQKTPMGWRTVEWNGIGVYDREGRYLGFQATGRDITKRMETEMAFRENEKKYRFLVNTAQELIFIINNTGKILFVNKYAIETTGYTEEEIIGKRITHFLTRDSIKKALFALTQELLGKPQPEMRVKIKTKTGEIKILDVANETTRVYGQDGKLNNLYIVARDVTNQLEAERELKESKEELEKLNNELERKVFERTEEIEKLLQQKDAFINQLSHDLRSPLTPLTALLPMIEEKEQDPHLKEDLGVIHCNVKYLNALIGKTIELAQLNSPKTKFSFDTTTLLDEIKAVVKNNKLVFEKNDIKIKNKVDKHILVKTDKLRFRQLFDNLISNAVKYSPHGGTITIDAQDDGGWVTVSIKDTGIGMIREELNHIFEEFYKADWSRHDHMSSGLGLSICKSIVKKHGGRIWAESPGKRKGTTVFFTIPSSSKEGGNK